MPPIPIYTDKPITATKPSGVTPQTAAPVADTAGSPGSLGPTTAVPTKTAAYAPAQPGAAPSLPGPTAGPEMLRSAGAQPTPTRAVDSNAGPPAPQPGAAPTASGARPTIPPPPKAGEVCRPPERTAAAPQPGVSMPYPSQMAVPPPNASLGGQQRGTSATTAPSSTVFASPLVGGGGEGSGSGGPGICTLEHPPGYHQDIHASGFNSSQQAGHNALASAAGGRTSLGPEAGGDEGVWNTAKKWAQQAGEGLANAEQEVWKRINKG